MFNHTHINVNSIILIIIVIISLESISTVTSPDSYSLFRMIYTIFLAFSDDSSERMRNRASEYDSFHYFLFKFLIMNGNGWVCKSRVWEAFYVFQNFL